MSARRTSDPIRRRMVAQLLAGAAIAPLALLLCGQARAAELPLVDPSSPAARKLKYVSDASQMKATAKGNNCSSCGLYQGADGSKRGPCQLFPGRDVSARGWCSSWQPQM